MITHRIALRDIPHQINSGETRRVRTRTDSWYLFGVVLLYRKQTAL